MDDAALQALSKSFDAHSGHLIGVLAIWVLNRGLQAGKDFLQEVRAMKDSMVLLNQQMAVVVTQIQDHDKRLVHLEAPKL